jgi:fibronectin type 3 domain-containing protein
VLLCLLLTACGKEAPPLPPFIRIPEAVKDLKVAQSGHTLILTWTNPARNIDGSAATNLAHVQIRSDDRQIAILDVNAPGQPQSDSIPLGAEDGRRTFSLLVDTTQGKTSQSSNVAAITPVDVPGAVSQFRAVVDQRRIMLDWRKPAEHPELADAYVITRSDMPAEPQTVSTTNYEDPQYEPGKTVTYQVTAVRRAGETMIPGMGPASVTVKIEDKTPPQIPSGLEIVQSDTGAYLTWNPNSETDLVGYRVFGSDRPNGDFRPISDRVISTNAFFDASYRPGHYYRVSAVDEFGNESTMSDPLMAP